MTMSGGNMSVKAHRARRMVAVISAGSILLLAGTANAHATDPGNLEAGVSDSSTSESTSTGTIPPSPSRHTPQVSAPQGAPLP